MFLLQQNYERAKEKISTWIKETHEVINEKMDEFQLETESLTQSSIEKFDEIFKKMSSCELAN